MKIAFICTGGTIDKDYASNKGTYNFEIAEPAVKRILKKINPNFEYRIQSILKKDSLDMDNTDREKVYEACKIAPENKIIVTHGTDTMIDTAKVLSRLKNKTIVLVGAAQPERFVETDASFNVGGGWCCPGASTRSLYCHEW